jgi:hypothetical protein
LTDPKERRRHEKPKRIPLSHLTCNEDKGRDDLPCASYIDWVEAGAAKICAGGDSSYLWVAKNFLVTGNNQPHRWIDQLDVRYELQMLAVGTQVKEFKLVNYATNQRKAVRISCCCLAMSCWQESHGGRRAHIIYELVARTGVFVKLDCFSIAQKQRCSGFHVVPTVPAIPVGTDNETDNEETTRRCMPDLGVKNNRVTVTKTTLSHTCTGEDVEHSTIEWRAYSVSHSIMDAR